MDERTCTECGQCKPIGDYHLDKTGPGGRRNKCKTCRSQQMKSWYADNQERQRDRQRARYDSNGDAIRKQDMERYERNKEARKALATQHWYKRRARLLSHNYNHAVTPALVRKRDGDACCYCGEVMTFINRQGVRRPPLQATLEHIIPASRGGHHDWDNVALCCLTCNMRKNGADPEPWIKMLAERGFIAAPPSEHLLAATT